MQVKVNADDNRLAQSKKSYFYLAIGIVCVLLMPAIAMQFTEEVDWKLGDFLVMAILLVSFGTFFIVVSRKFSVRSKRVIAALTVLSFLLVWAELAVGLLSSLV